MHRFLIASLIILATTCSLSAAKESRLDLVPARASASLIFRSVTVLKEKGDKLLEATVHGINLASIVINYGATALGVMDVYDPDQPVAVVWLNHDQVTLSENDKKSRWQKPIAVVVTIKNIDALAAQLKVGVEQLKAGEIVTQEGQMGYEHRHYKVHGNQLWIGSHIEAIDFAINGDRLSDFIAKGRRKHLLENDLILSFSRNWEEFDPEFAAVAADQWIKEHPDADEEEQKALRELFDILQAARHAIFGFRTEPDGLELDLDVHFDPAQQETIRKAVRRISPKSEPATLAGMPANGKHGELIVAHAARTDGKATLAVTSIIMRDTFRIWPNWWDELAGRGFLNRSQQLELLGLFGEVWRELDGYRTGLYQNANTERDGLVSLVSVLDSEDADEFILKMKELGGLADGSGIDEKELKKENSHSRRKIRKLVGQLTSPDYATRQSAATKLILIGGPALAAVEKAEKSGDPAVTRRAGTVAVRIRQSVKLKRERALQPSLLSKVEPKFVFHIKAEERAGLPVHILEMQSKLTPSMQSNVAALLGPDWERVRLVPRDRQVVVLLGSNTKLLDTTLTNLASDRPGLTADPKNDVYNRPLNRKQTSKLHVSTQRFLALKEGKPMEKRHPHELSSISLTLQSTRFNVELRLPASEIRTLVKGFWR